MGKSRKVALGVLALVILQLPGGAMTMASGSARARNGWKYEPALTDMIVYFTQGGQRVGAIPPDGTCERYPEFGLQGQPLRRGKVSRDGKQAEVLNLTDSKYWRYDFIMAYHIASIPGRDSYQCLSCMRLSVERRHLPNRNCNHDHIPTDFSILRNLVLLYGGRIFREFR